MEVDLEKFAISTVRKGGYKKSHSSQEELARSKGVESENIEVYFRTKCHFKVGQRTVVLQLTQSCQANYCTFGRDFGIQGCVFYCR